MERRKQKALNSLNEILSEYPNFKSWVKSDFCTLAELEAKAILNYLETQEHLLLADKLFKSKMVIEQYYKKGKDSLLRPSSYAAYARFEVHKRFGQVSSPMLIKPTSTQHFPSIILQAPTEFILELAKQAKGNKMGFQQFNPSKRIELEKLLKTNPYAVFLLS